MFDALKAAFEKKELPPLESGAMCYMMSRQAHLSDRDGNWHPHLMFFLPSVEAAAWGANLAGSPIFEDDKFAGPYDRVYGSGRHVVGRSFPLR